MIDPVRARDRTGEADLDSGSARDSQSERAGRQLCCHSEHRGTGLRRITLTSELGMTYRTYKKNTEDSRTPQKVLTEEGGEGGGGEKIYLKWLS